MARAILIAGHGADHDKFLIDVARARDYLRRCAGIDDAVVIDAGHPPTGGFDRALRLALFDRPAEPLLLLYSGHGLKSGWSVGELAVFPYRRLAEWLDWRLGPVLLINDCCHSGAVIRHLENRPRLDRRVSAITACTAGMTAVAGLTARVFSAWKRGHDYEPRLRRRFFEWAAPLDRRGWLAALVFWIVSRSSLLLNRIAPGWHEDVFGAVVTYAETARTAGELRPPACNELRWGVHLDALFFPGDPSGP